MRSDFSTSRKDHITKIQKILNDAGIKFINEDVSYILILVLLSINYKWSHLVSLNKSNLITFK